MKQISKIGLGLWLHLALLALTVLIFLATFSMPLLSTPGFESANLYVLILGPLLAFAALGNTRARLPDFRPIIQRELSWLLLHIALNFALLFARSLAVTSCSLGSGVGAYFLILVPPLLLNVVIGSIIACAIQKPSIKFLIWLTFYAAYFAFKLYFWWHDSAFRFLSDVSILLTSDLVQGGEITLAVMTFRLGTLGFFLALLALALGLWSKSRSRLSYVQRPAFYFVLFFALGACALLLHTQSLQAVGKNKNQLKQDYTLRQTFENISVYANPNLSQVQETKAILDEALLYQKRLSKKLGKISSSPIIIWLHSNDEEKALYTGAKNVHFAQPKHREIHISNSHTPHQVLGHELAHIYLGEYTTTLWGLPGRWLVIPNMALTEGLAMVLTPELAVANNLDLMQQAQALQQAGLGIDITTLFSMNPLDFSKSNFRASYIFAGAFLQFYLENIAKADRPYAIQKMAHLGSLGGLFSTKDERNTTLAKFSSRLAEPMPAYALLWAERQFGTTGILSADCTISKEPVTIFWQAIQNLEIDDAIKILANISPRHQVDLALKAIKALLNKHESAQALKLILVTKNFMRDLDARLAELLMSQLHALIQQKHFSDAFLLIKNIDPMSLNLSARRELVIQAELLAERSHSIDFSYEELLDSTQNLLTEASLDHQALDLKFAYTLGKYSGPPTVAIHMANYLYARMLMRAKNYQEALIFIESILNTSIGLPTIIIDETFAMKADCLMALKKYREAAQVFSYLLTRNISPSARQVYNDRLERNKL